MGRLYGSSNSAVLVGALQGSPYALPSDTLLIESLLQDEYVEDEDQADGQGLDDSEGHTSGGASTALVIRDDTSRLVPLERSAAHPENLVVGQVSSKV